MAVGAAQQEEAAAAAEVEQLNRAVQDVRGQVEQRRADSQAQSSQGAVVKALMAAKSSKEIPGILGRLGNTHQQCFTTTTCIPMLSQSPCDSVCKCGVVLMPTGL